MHYMISSLFIDLISHLLNVEHFYHQYFQQKLTYEKASLNNFTNLRNNTVY